MLTLNKTFSIKAKEIEKKWFIVDATDLIVGRLASRLAIILKGKHKPSYTPHMDCGDNVIVINADKLKFTGKKLDDKTYYRHTGYPGGIRETSPRKIFARGYSERVLSMAVKRMLGRGALSSARMSNLYIYPGSEHKQVAQSPVPLDIAAMNRKNKISAV